MAKSFLLNNGKVPLAHLVHCLAFTTNDDLSAADRPTIQFGSQGCSSEFKHQILKQMPPFEIHANSECGTFPARFCQDGPNTTSESSVYTGAVIRGIFQSETILLCGLYQGDVIGRRPTFPNASPYPPIPRGFVKSHSTQMYS